MMSVAISMRGRKISEAAASQVPLRRINLEIRLPVTAAPVHRLRPSMLL